MLSAKRASLIDRRALFDVGVSAAQRQLNMIKQQFTAVYGHNLQGYPAMAKNVTQKLIESHWVEGRMKPGEEIGLKIDQTLTQDVTGTLVMLVMLEFEALGIPRVRTELSAQYVDHNLIQEDFKNPDDHLFLRSACKRFGLWYSRPGNGVSHPVHMERFGVPGKTLLGSDSHTCAAGSLGMLAIGAGGLEVTMAMAGEPFHRSLHGFGSTFKRSPSSGFRSPIGSLPRLWG